ncbi:MAG: hypothetical protein O3C48_06945 [Crenarchaeota archaeon]|nr:hypothetical protein [Thermoproteota archaeon]
MARKLGAPIFIGIITVLAVVFLAGGGTDDKDTLRQTFDFEAIYYETGHVEISFFDKSGKTTFVVMEILGMDESFQKTFSDSEFIEIVAFPNIPKYGWAIHPIVLEIDHEELGHIQLKTEIHFPDEPLPPVIYARP